MTGVHCCRGSNHLVNANGEGVKLHLIKCFLTRKIFSNFQLVVELAARLLPRRLPHDVRDPPRPLPPRRPPPQPRPRGSLLRRAAARGHALGLRPGEPPTQPLHGNLHEKIFGSFKKIFAGILELAVLPEGGQREQQEAVPVHAAPPPAADDPHVPRQEE